MVKKRYLRLGWWGWLALAAWLLVGAGLALVYGLAEAGRGSFYLFNADALYIPALLKDIVSGVSLTGWKFPPAPYFFPDIPVFFVLNAALRNLRLAVVGYGVLQFVGFLVGWVFLAWAGGEDHRLAGVLAPLGGGLWLLNLAQSETMPVQSQTLWTALQNGHHFAAFVLLLFALGCAARALVLGSGEAGRRGALGWAGAAMLLTALTAWGDPLFLLWFVLPAGMALLLTAWIGTRQMGTRPWAVSLAVGIAVAGVLGLLAERLLVKEDSMGSYLQWSAAGVQEGLNWAGREAQAAWAGQPAAVLLWGLGLAASLWALWRSLRVGKDPLAPQVPGVTPARLFLLAFFALEPLIVLLGLALSGNVVARQMLPALTLPLVFLFYVSAGWLVRHSPKVAAGTALAVLTLLSFVMMVRMTVHGIFPGPFPGEALQERADCLDAAARQRGWTAGLADYWQARPLTLFSRQGLKLAQVQSDLSMDHWINNLEDYRRAFQFVVVNPDPAWEGRLDESEIRRRFGEPAAVIACPGIPVPLRILAYDRAGDEPFQQQFLGNPTFARFDGHGQSFTFLPAQLPARTGERTAGGRLAEESRSQAGVLVDGPRLTLPAGNYTFSITYAAEGGSGINPVGRWKVGGMQGVEQAGDLNAGRAIVVGMFTLAEEGQVGFQVLYDGQGRLEVEKIELTRR